MWDEVTGRKTQKPSDIVTIQSCNHLLHPTETVKPPEHVSHQQLLLTLYNIQLRINYIELTGSD